MCHWITIRYLNFAKGQNLECENLPFYQDLVLNYSIQIKLLLSFLLKKILSIKLRVLDDILEESIDEDGCESSHNSSGI